MFIFSPKCTLRNEFWKFSFWAAWNNGRLIRLGRAHVINRLITARCPVDSIANSNLPVDIDATNQTRVAVISFTNVWVSDNKLLRCTRQNSSSQTYRPISVYLNIITTIIIIVINAGKISSIWRRRTRGVYLWHVHSIHCHLNANTVGNGRVTSAGRAIERKLISRSPQMHAFGIGSSRMLRHSATVIRVSVIYTRTCCILDKSISTWSDDNFTVCEQNNKI